jgi:hypothetical protein
MQYFMSISQSGCTQKKSRGVDIGHNGTEPLHCEHTCGYFFVFNGPQVLYFLFVCGFMLQDCQSFGH